MLAFSSVAHAGDLLTAVVAAPGLGTEAVLFYLVAYAAVNLGGFGALAALAKGGREPLTLDDVAGLGERRPLLAAGLTVFLISLTGVPVSAGFVGKFHLFRAAVDAGYVSLAIVGMVMSVVSAYYYLRVVVAMYMREPAGDDVWAPVGVAPGLALALAALVTLGLGVYPAPVLHWARAAAGCSSSIEAGGDPGVHGHAVDVGSPVQVWRLRDAGVAGVAQERAGGHRVSRPHHGPAQVVEHAQQPLPVVEDQRVPAQRQRPSEPDDCARRGPDLRPQPHRVVEAAVVLAVDGVHLHLHRRAPEVGLRAAEAG
jgi:hypothetical protein